jgi:hypothetical protein
MPTSAFRFLAILQANSVMGNADRVTNAARGNWRLLASTGQRAP